VNQHKSVTPPQGTHTLGQVHVTANCSHTNILKPQGQESRNKKRGNTPYSPHPHPFCSGLSVLTHLYPLYTHAHASASECATAQCSHYEREMASKRARRSQARLAGLTANCANTGSTSNKTHRPCLLRRGIHFGWRL